MQHRGRIIVGIVMALVVGGGRAFGEEAAAKPGPDGAVPAEAQAAAPQEGHVPEAVAQYQLAASEAEALQICDSFIQRVMAGEYDAAFQQIRPYFPISEKRFIKLAEETKKQHGLAQLQFGKPLGQVFVSAQTIKDTVVKYRFLEKFEWDVMYWEFMFYKPQNGWLLNGLGFDDDIQSLFRN